VCVLSAAEIGNFYYGPGHPMKPHRKPPPALSCRLFLHRLLWIPSAFASSPDCGCVLVAAGIRMCHNLLLNYRLYEKMDVFVRSRPLSLHCFPPLFCRALASELSFACSL